jgi:hypothetical protein
MKDIPCTVRELWADMYHKAVPLIESYPSDLCIDYTYLCKYIEESATTGKPIYWSVGQCGTHIGFEPIWRDLESYEKYSHHKITSHVDKYGRLQTTLEPTK